MFQIPEKLEKYRVKQGQLASSKEKEGNNGAFYFKGPKGDKLGLIVSDGTDGSNWEHVSVSLKNRCPHWDELVFIKNLFWSEDDACFQLHPAKSEYVNNHKFCLHIWRPINQKVPTPPPEFVGML